MKSSDIAHICQDGTAAEHLRTMYGNCVTGIADDCRVGPLADIDSSFPEKRAAFWREVFASEKRMRRFDWHAELSAITEKPSELESGASEIVIWAGRHPSEQLMRRRVHWWLQNTSVHVSEVLLDSGDMENKVLPSQTAVALTSAERLAHCFEKRLPAQNVLRRSLAGEWRALRDNGTGLRHWESGHWLERPIDDCDVKLLSLVGQQPLSLRRVVGQAMALTGLSDSFCTWRFAIQVQTGGLLLVSGRFDEPDSAMVCR